MDHIIERINQLTAERARLYRRNVGRAGKGDLQLRIHEIDAQLGRLWDERRRERIGRREGIDLVVDKVYEGVYGADFEETVRPTPVAEPEDGKMRVAA